MRNFKPGILLCLLGLILLCPLRAAEKPGLTLEQLVKMAVANQPQLAGAQAQIDQNRGSSIQAYSSYYPQLNMQGGYNKNTQQNFTSSTNSINLNSQQWNSSVSLQQFLTDFGKTRAKVKAADAALSQAQLSYRQTYEVVVLGVYQAYYQVLQNKAQLDVQQKNLDSLKLHLEQAQHFYKAGTKPKIDVTQAQVNLLNGEYQLEQARNSLAQSRAQLVVAVGKQDPVNDYEVAGALEYLEYSIPLAEAMNKAFLVRPDLQAAQAQLAGAQANLTAKQKNMNPALNGSASYGFQDVQFPQRNNFFNYGLSLSLPVFDGFQTKGQVIQAQGQVKQVQSQVDTLQLNIFQQVKQSWLNLETSRKNYRVALESVKLAQENQDLAQQRYQAGVGSYLEFFDAQYNYLQAESNLITALGNYNSALASLKQAMGILE